MDINTLKTTLGGVKVNPRIEWEGTQIVASFEQGSAQASIETEAFEFVGAARDRIFKHIKDGYYFEGLPITQQIKNGPNNYNAFRGYLDLQDTYIDYSSDRVSAKIKESDSVPTLLTKLSGLTYGLLDEQGFIASKDVQYVVEKKNNFVEIVTAGITIYLMTKELIEIQKALAKNINQAISLITGSTTGTLGAVLLLAGEIIVNATFSYLISEALLELSEKMLANFISPVRKYKQCSYRTLLTAACLKLGYKFESGISDLDNLCNLPSRPFDEEITSGIPRLTDPGYICSEFFGIVRDMTSSDLSIVGDTVHLEWRDSNFWIKTATWKLPSVHKEQKRKNGEDLFGTTLVSFRTDVNDEHTINNIKGTFFEARTFQTNYKYGIEYLTIDQLDDKLIPFCLPNRKDRLNELEEILKSLAELVDEVISIVGGTSNLASLVQNRIGMLKLGTDQHSIPRVLYLVNGKLPANHRSKLSAIELYNNYMVADSFVHSKNGGQKEVYENVRVLFGFKDFTELINNSYFTTDDGRVGKVTRIEWTIDGDYANISYWVQDPNPTDKLYEFYIEPQ